MQARRKEMKSEVHMGGAGISASAHRVNVKALQQGRERLRWTLSRGLQNNIYRCPEKMDQFKVRTDIESQVDVKVCSPYH
jgi:hypothetical protein